MKAEILERSLLCDGNETTDFIKSHHLSPDGYHALLISESNYITHWDISSELIHENLYYPSEVNTTAIPQTHLKLQNINHIGEAIYDCHWYPHMNHQYDATCCYVTTSRDHPIHLWNLDGTIRCSYLGYNHLDELEAAISLCFNPTGERLYGGYNRMIRGYDLAIPGKQTISLPTSLTKRDPYGQKGLISTLSFNPMNITLFAAGSYDSSSGIYLYQENMKKYVDRLSGGEEFGCTCLKWSPCGNYLWAGGRKNSIISCYDIRSPKVELGRSTNHSHLLIPNRLPRHLSSNQRMIFSLDPWGKYLATGTQDGRLLVYDTNSFEEIFSTKIADSCVNTVTFHPYSSLLMITTGERVFSLRNVLEDEDLQQDQSNSSSEVMFCRCSRGDSLPIVTTESHLEIAMESISS